jgi:hypothetical protein
LASNRQLAAKLNELEQRIATHDKSIVSLFQTVRSLMAVPEKPKRGIGFSKDRARRKRSRCPAGAGFTGSTDSR